MEILPPYKPSTETRSRKIGPYTETMTLTPARLTVTYSPPIPPALEAELSDYWRRRVDAAVKAALSGFPIR